MGVARDFIINIGSLAAGEHEFEFEVKDSFFKRFEHSVIEKGSVDVLVVVKKKDNMLLLDFTMEGTVTVQCDRCLEDLDLDIESYNELIVKIGEENEELSEKIVVISSKEYEIDVAQYIYEFISLIIPSRCLSNLAPALLVLQACKTFLYNKLLLIGASVSTKDFICCLMVLRF